MNHTVCEIVSSDCGQTKINVNGYIMIKNSSRDDLYYWSCEKRDTLYCKARAATIFVDGQHRLRRVSDHNHGTEASCTTVLRTDELPVQITQTVVTKNYKSPSHQVEVEEEVFEEEYMPVMEGEISSDFRHRMDERYFII